MVRTLSIVSALVLVPALAHAQQPAATGQTSAGGQPTVTVIQKSGSELKGKLLLLDNASVIVLTNGQEQRFSLDGVRRVEKRGDSLKNGALIGASIGFLGGLLIGELGSCQPIRGAATDCASPSPGVVAVTGAVVYAGIGAGIDALIKGRTILYQSPTATAALVITPVSIGFRVRW